VYKDVVLFAGGENFVPHRAGTDKLTALSAETGRKLWTGEHPPSGYQSPEDVLVADGLVWCGATTNTAYDGVFTGRDPWTGEVKVSFAPDVETYWFHHRCYRGRATDRYLLMSRTGIEFLDLDEQKWRIHHWVRGACLYGVMPCNGMIYAPQHPCGCYPESKQYGFSVLAPASASRAAGQKTRQAGRLEKGPAYASLSNPDAPSVKAKEGDWPTFRGNNRRSGQSPSAVPAEVKPLWKTKLGGRLSTLVLSGGRVFVTSIDTHTVHALEAETGNPLWHFTAGGRVDSPPTLWRGRVLFGSADGHVYCLRARDGALAWRFRAAPSDRRAVVFEQVESLWPVHGSVLVEEVPVGTAGKRPVLFCTAGRSMFLDGGLRLVRLDPITGERLSETVMDEHKPDGSGTLQDNIRILNMPVAQPDILSSDGERVYMKSQVFSLEGRRQALGPHSGKPSEQASVQRGEEAHLFCPSGFLDDSWWHRTYWVYGRSFAGGHGGYWQAGRYAPSGRIIVHDESRVYVFGRKPQYYKWTTPLEHHLWAADRQPPLVPESEREATDDSSPGTWVRVDNAPALNPAGKALAVEAWVKAAKPQGVVLARGGPAEGYALVLLKGRPHFMIRSGGKLATVAADRRAVGRWVHLAGVLTAGRKLEIYIDGKLAGAAEAPALIAGEPQQALEIGADDGSGVGDYNSPFAFTGLIDEVRVFFGTVTPVEMARHASDPDELDAEDAELVLRFSFDKGDATDDTGGKNDGHLGKVEVVEGRLGKALELTAAKPRTRTSAYHVRFHWSEDLPLFARAMVLAGGTLFIAGPPDLLDEEQAARAIGDKDVQARLVEQAASIAGKRGALLRAVSAKDGSQLAEHELDVPPVFDGMIAAHGALLWTTVDGHVVCWK
jgi:outer membrane protein assembly factor BamB